MIFERRKNKKPVTYMDGDDVYVTGRNLIVSTGDLNLRQSGDRVFVEDEDDEVNNW